MAKNKSKKNRPKNSSKKVWNQFGSQIFLALLLLLGLVMFYSALTENRSQTEEISLSELAALVLAAKVEKIAVAGDELSVTLVDGTEKLSKKETESSLSETLINYGVSGEQLTALQLDVTKAGGLGYWVLNILPFLIPLIFLVVFFWLVSRQMKGASMQAFSFGQSRARIIDPNDKSQKVLFKDVAGAKEAKDELMEIVDFLKNPKKFLDIGARIPKGVLMMGAPGTGKTLLARAVAGEAHVPFFYLSGSEFVEMFVGVGASRVRDLFKMAKRTAPAIIFIDEIDAIGRHRGSGMGGGNDEREQTLNQILVEMDGFEPNEKLIVMAATNRPDVLDRALLRPGRFDRRVILEAPDINDREEILKLHANKKPLAEDVNIRVIAQRTPGFSGADLANLMNEAAILAARENRTEVGQFDLIRSVEKVMLGPERKSHILSEKEKEITAYHEMGHALVASVLSYADPVHKVSIISRGHAAGYTLKLPLEDRKLNSKNEFLDDLAVSLGGYAVEQLIFGDITTGASNDIQVATSLARAMVTRYGMSEKVGPIDFGASTVSHLGDVPLSEKSASESTWAVIDGEVSALMKHALNRATEVVTGNLDALHHLSKELVRVETLERADFETLLKAHGIEPKVEPKLVSEIAKATL
ncbi:MAG: cell division protein FtsH [Candidatus Vogelbacteria bacterium RIFOXYD1_FULL_46_19]|uniref:ATP-dependent zinc metalloprotease FtsH n=1 Tax=Candidatus Vogelbacteria bacterium RIFOXYD1_FULL_46_19 TaxID=1802439 RepID=A0A1G2QHF6_9BACT|nr:MAG: cell division protein FtsH [Candidatus Vogelbacteria bacterium RIFOXYD1_FULL_46_19]